MPRGLVALLAVVALVAILFTVASRQPKETRGWAEFLMYPKSCLLATRQRLNAAYCINVGPGLYRLGFTESLKGKTVVASRALPDLGPISASIQGPGIVVVRVPKITGPPIRASVVVP